MNEDPVVLKHRIQSALVISAALLAAAFWLPPRGVLGVLLAVCALGTLEFYSLLDAAGIAHFKIVGTAGGLALVATTWLSLRHGSAAVSYEWEWFVLFGAMAAVLLRQFPQKHNPHPLSTIAGTLLGVMYVPFLFNFFTKLLMAWGGVEGRLLVMYTIVVVKSNDIGAYLIGVGLGRHKLLPRISPAKTWEGLLGGLAVAVLVSWIFCLGARGNLGVVRLTAAQALGLGLLLGGAGVLGDLTESLLKRAAGVKDSGRIILGMGGVLDVLDSLLFAAPAMYIYARLFLPRVSG